MTTCKERFHQEESASPLSASPNLPSPLPLHTIRRCIPMHLHGCALASRWKAHRLNHPGGTDGNDSASVKIKLY